MHVGLDRVNWPLDDEANPDRGGQVYGDVGKIYELGNQRPVSNAANPVRKASLADQAGEIRHLPSG